MISPLRNLRTGLLLLVPAAALAAVSADATPLPLQTLGEVAWNADASPPGAKPASAAERSSESEIVDEADWQETAVRRPPKGAIVKKKEGPPCHLPKGKKASAIRHR